MESWRYKAVDQRGRTVRGRIEALNPADLEVRLGRAGLDLISHGQVRVSHPLFADRGIRTVELITLCFQLEQLIRAGVPIVEALADLRDTVDHRRLRQVTAAMVESIEGGKNLSQAMSDFPGVFDSVFVSLVRAGEQSGRLPEVMRKIIENLKWQDEQAAYTRKLLLYPAIVTCVVTGALLFLMLQVVPQLVSFLGNMGEALPLQTRALIATSGFLAAHWLSLLGLVLGLLAVVPLTLKFRPEAARHFDAWKLRLPLVGPVLRKIIITRICSVFAIMYTSGITVLECLRTGEEVAGNRAIRRALREAGRRIADGGGISASFAATGLFPPLVIRMLRVGENTGALDEALENVTYFFTRDVRESVTRLQTLIMPVLTVVLGLIVLWIMSAVLGPVYDLFTRIEI
ncbi:MAG: hypothetical protein RL434_723 [Pseudomonadota bacterium]|jgi:type IV pilus assembly protein PilC